jgi:geranylgeranylglycerol-phosphate geranylgeranyltransferase
MAVLQLVRFENILFVSTLATIGLVAAADPSRLSIVAVTLTSAAILATGNIFNDLMDEALDRVGKPWRPLPSGRITRFQAMWLLAVCSLAAVAGIALLPGVGPRLLACLMLALAFLYSAVLKGVPLLGNVSVAVEVVLVLVLAAGVAGDADYPVVWLGALIGVSYLIYEFAKTARDQWHDRLFLDTAAARWTPAIVWSIFVALLVVDVFVALLAVTVGSLDVRLVIALVLPVGPFAIHALRQAELKDVNPVGRTVSASKILFVPALAAMALWL